MVHTAAATGVTRKRPTTAVQEVGAATPIGTIRPTSITIAAATFLITGISIIPQDTLIPIRAAIGVDTFEVLVL